MLFVCLLPIKCPRHPGLSFWQMSFGNDTEGTVATLLVSHSDSYHLKCLWQHLGSDAVQHSGEKRALDKASEILTPGLGSVTIWLCDLE